VAFVATIDACVLHRPPVRDLLIRLAVKRLFRLSWSERILDEMVHSVLRARPDLTPDQLTRTRDLMVEALPAAMTEGYEPLIEALPLPDPDDRHVLAVAIRSGAQVIVTDNLRDFPAEILGIYDIEAQSADTFVTYLVDLSPATILDTLAEQAGTLTDMSVDRLLDTLARDGLVNAVEAVRSL